MVLSDHPSLAYREAEPPAVARAKPGNDNTTVRAEDTDAQGAGRSVQVASTETTIDGEHRCLSPEALFQKWKTSEFERLVGVPVNVVGEALAKLGHPLRDESDGGVQLGTTDQAEEAGKAGSACCRALHHLRCPQNGWEQLPRLTEHSDNCNAWYRAFRVRHLVERKHDCIRRATAAPVSKNKPVRRKKHPAATVHNRNYSSSPSTFSKRAPVKPAKQKVGTKKKVGRKPALTAASFAIDPVNNSRRQQLIEKQAPYVAEVEKEFHLNDVRPEHFVPPLDGVTLVPESAVREGKILRFTDSISGPVEVQEVSSDIANDKVVVTVKDGTRRIVVDTGRVPTTYKQFVEKLKLKQDAETSKDVHRTQEKFEVDLNPPNIQERLGEIEKRVEAVTKVVENATLAHDSAHDKSNEVDEFGNAKEFHEYQDAVERALRESLRLDHNPPRDVAAKKHQEAFLAKATREYLNNEFEKLVPVVWSTEPTTRKVQVNEEKPQVRVGRLYPDLGPVTEWEVCHLDE